jgi:hypothetical protein
MKGHDYRAASLRRLPQAIETFTVDCLDRDLLNLGGELPHPRDWRQEVSRENQMTLGDKNKESNGQPDFDDN